MEREFDIIEKSITIILLTFVLCCVCACSSNHSDRDKHFSMAERITEEVNPEEEAIIADKEE